MPELKNTDVPARQIRKGDVLRDVLGTIKSGKTVDLNAGPTVESTKTGNANVTIETSAGRMIVDGDATFTVERQVDTQEEKIARAEADVRRYLEGWVGAEAKAIEAFNEYAEKNGFVYAIEWGHPARVIEARVIEGYAKNVLAAVDERGVSLVDALREARESATEHVMRNVRAGSRSTSQWSNLTEDHELEAHTEIVDSFGWLKGTDAYLIGLVDGKY